MSTEENPPNVGATGRFPDGEKVRPDDLGELRASLTVDRENSRIFMDFGKPIQWLAMSPPEAEAWGQGLLAAARKARG